MTAEGQSKGKKRGPKGGVKHKPGRGHDWKSIVQKKQRFARKAARKRREQQEAAEEAWRTWDQLPEEVKQLLGPAGQPTVPRPSDD